MRSIQSIHEKEGGKEVLLSSLANGLDKHSSHRYDFSGRAEWQEEEEEGSDEDPPTSIANSWDNCPSCACDFPSEAKEEEVGEGMSKGVNSPSLDVAHYLL
jgi:hypothetical protein